MNTVETVRAYGAGMSDGSFQMNVFLRKPTTILRIVALMTGLAQWIAVSRGGWYKPKSGEQEICLYANSSSTCSFGSAMGFFAVLSALGLIFLDAKFENISSIPTRKRAVTSDMIISGILAFLFLITFFSLWSKYGEVDVSESYDGGTAKSAIIFALLSTIAWGGATFFVWRRYEEGVITNFLPSYEQDFTSGMQAGTGCTTGGENSIAAFGQSFRDTYQEAPFTAINTVDSPVDVSKNYQGY